MAGIGMEVPVKVLALEMGIASIGVVVVDIPWHGIICWRHAIY